VKRMLICVLAAVALIVAGCGQPAAPARVGAPMKLTTSRVARASQAGPVLGVDVESDVNYSVATAKTYGRRVVGYIHSGLHANSVGLVWDFCDPSFTANLVGRCQRTLSSRAVRGIAEEARQEGVTVQLRPIIRVGPPANWGDSHLSWEGFINPSNQTKWFHRLLRAETPYLKILRGFPRSQFVVGTEPYYIASSPDWRWLERKARSVCQCATVVSAQFERYQVGTVPSRKTAGVDWYAHLLIPNDSSQARVTAAFEASLKMVPRRLLAGTWLDEEGIRATSGAYQHPEEWDINGPSDPEVQARYFTAACQTAEHYHMRGIYFYQMPLNDNPAHPFTFPAYFVKNAGGKAIRGCSRMFAKRHHA
jgi:hypothetical protein